MCLGLVQEVWVSLCIDSKCCRLWWNVSETLHYNMCNLVLLVYDAAVYACVCAWLCVCCTHLHMHTYVHMYLHLSICNTYTCCVCMCVLMLKCSHWCSCVHIRITYVRTYVCACCTLLCVRTCILVWYMYVPTVCCVYVCVH